jgi:hypothetical protein
VGAHLSLEAVEVRPVRHSSPEPLGWWASPVNPAPNLTSQPRWSRR